MPYANIQITIRPKTVHLQRKPNLENKQSYNNMSITESLPYSDLFYDSLISISNPDKSIITKCKMQNATEKNLNRDHIIRKLHNHNLTNDFMIDEQRWFYIAFHFLLFSWNIFKWI